MRRHPAPRGGGWRRSASRWRRWRKEACRRRMTEHRSPVTKASRERRVAGTPGGQQTIARWYGCRRGANLRRERRRGERAGAERKPSPDRQRGEPHDRHRGATNPEPIAGASRRGGARPRGRNRSRPWSGRPEGCARVHPGVDGGGETDGGEKNRRRGVVGSNQRPAWTEGSENQARDEGVTRIGNEPGATFWQRTHEVVETARWARQRPNEPPLPG